MEVEEEEKQRNESEPWGSLERISEKCVLLFEALESLPPNEDWEQTDIWLHIFSFIQQVHDVDPVRLTDGDTLTRRGKDPLLTCRLVCKAWRQFSDSTLPFVLPLGFKLMGTLLESHFRSRVNPVRLYRMKDFLLFQTKDMTKLLMYLELSLMTLAESLSKFDKHELFKISNFASLLINRCVHCYPSYTYETRDKFLENIFYNVLEKFKNNQLSVLCSDSCSIEFVLIESCWNKLSSLLKYLEAIVGSDSKRKYHLGFTVSKLVEKLEFKELLVPVCTYIMYQENYRPVSTAFKELFDFAGLPYYGAEDITKESEEEELRLKPNDSDTIFIVPKKNVRNMTFIMKQLDIMPENGFILLPITMKNLKTACNFQIWWDESNITNPANSLMYWNTFTRADLFENILTATAIKYQDLSDSLCQTIANMIKGRSPEEIRKQFNIRNDFTPEEEEKVTKENEWCTER